MAVPGRDDSRYLEDAAIAFVTYCDEHGLSRRAGIALAEQPAEELGAAAEDRDLAEGGRT